MSMVTPPLDAVTTLLTDDHIQHRYSSNFVCFLSAMSNRAPSLRDEVTRLDAEILTLKGILMTSPYSETTETRFLFNSQLGHHGPSAVASRQARLPPGFLLVPRFYALHDRTAELVQENAALKEALDKLTSRVLELEAFKESSTKSANKDAATLPDPGTPPTEGPRTPPYGEASLPSSTPSAPRKRKAPSPDPVPKRQYLPGHAPSRFAPGPLPSRPLPDCLVTKPSNEEI